MDRSPLVKSLKLVLRSHHVETILSILFWCLVESSHWHIYLHYLQCCWLRQRGIQVTWHVARNTLQQNIYFNIITGHKPIILIRRHSCKCHFQWKCNISVSQNSRCRSRTEATTELIAWWPRKMDTRSGGPRHLLPILTRSGRSRIYTLPLYNILWLYFYQSFIKFSLFNAYYLM